MTPEPATVEQIARNHEPAYIDLVRRISETGGGNLDLDTVLSTVSYEAAVLAAGSGVQAVERAAGGGSPAFLLVRPPGHHALRGRGMGFCLFNNIAVAAEHALEALGMERVLIVDWDVHHGNGTQDSFYDDPRVLFVSMHQQNHYPGTGAVGEVGAGPGAGFTVNLPLPAGCGDGGVWGFFHELVLPLGRAFRPQLVLVSAGYDCQFRDPLGGLTLSEEAFQWMAARLRELALELDAGGPICFLEGGYDPQMLGRSITRTLHGLTGEEVAFEPEPRPVELAAVNRTLQSVAGFWPGIILSP